jgi:multiple sugar transport system substrate-binding protein
MEGFVNSAAAVEGLEFYKALYELLHTSWLVRWYMSENIDAYKSGQVAMQMNFAFIWPGVEADPNVGGGKSGYFANPAGPAGQFAQLGGQGISVVAYSDKQGRGAGIHQVVRSKGRPGRNGGNVGGYSALRAVVEDPGFATSQPYAQTFLDSMAIVKDFWAEPAYAICCFCPCRSGSTTMLLPGNGTAQEALDGLVEDWDEVFEDEGKK